MTEPSPDTTRRRQLLEGLYDAHRRRDIDAALAGLTADVEWPNVAAGTTLHGHDEVRAYWKAQFAAIDPRVEPTAFVVEDDRAVVTVHQVVRDLGGTILGDSVVTHTYRFRDGLVSSMRVDEAGPPSEAPAVDR